MPISFDAGFFEPPVSPDLVQGENAYDASSNVSATLGATATAGNLLVAAYFWSPGDGTAPTAPSAPTGYTELYNVSPLGSLFALFYKISDGTETAVTIGAEGALLFWEVQGVNTDQPITSAFATNSANSTTGVTVGPIVTAPNDALVMGVFGYADNDHAGSTTTHTGDNDQGDFYMGIRGDAGSGAEDFHIFCSWTEVTDRSNQSVTYDPVNATAEDNFASLFVINLDPVEHPTVELLEFSFSPVSSDASTNVSPETLELAFSPVSSDVTTNVSSDVLEFVYASLSSDSSTNAAAETLEFVFSTVNEDVVAGEEHPTVEVLEFSFSPISSDASTNVTPETLELAFSPVSSDAYTNVSPLTLETLFGSINQTTELSVDNIVAAIMDHVIDGYRVEDILRLNLAVSVGDVTQQANGRYTIYKPDDTQIRVEGKPAPNNGRDVTNIDVTP